MGFLDGDIAKLVADALIGAGMSKPATLIKVTPGTRTPGSVTAGTNPTTVSYPAVGIPVDVHTLMLSGTLITGADRVIRLYGARLPVGIVPEPGDHISMEGVTSTIVAGGVTRDPASACYVCQCRT